MFISELYKYRVDGCRVVRSCGFNLVWISCIILNQVIHLCQISVPVIVSGWWACYIWDMERKEIHILDPVLASSPYSIQNKHHEEAIKLLHKGLFTCMCAFSDDWDVSKTGWNAKFYDSLHIPSSR